MESKLVPSKETLDDAGKEQIRILKSKIQPFFNILDRSPTSDLEIALSSESDQMLSNGLLLNNDTIYQTQGILCELEAKHTHELQEMEKDWQFCISNLNQLKEDADTRLGYTPAHNTVRKALKVLKDALVERVKEKETRLAAIASATQELRSNLQAIWVECHIADEEKEDFIHKFECMDFTPDLLEAHREELKKWMIYRKKNTALIQKLNRRQDMWKQMVDLDSRAEDPNRFINRGATLLKDQQAMSTIQRGLPKIEEELIQLAKTFQASYGRPFKLKGKEISTLIKDDWAAFKDEKSKRKAASANHSSVPFQNFVPPPPPTAPTARGQRTPGSSRKRPAEQHPVQPSSARKSMRLRLNFQNEG